MSEILWSPPSGGSSQLARFAEHAAARGAPAADDYAALWEWSVRDLDTFWSAVWDHLDLPHDGEPSPALAHEAMPGAVWFPHLRLNYAEAMLAMPGRADDDVVVVARSQTRDDVRLTAAELRDAVARARAGLRRHGIGRGDRVAAFAPNAPETLVLLLAAASLGAIFSSCAPEFGVQSVVDRWQQTEPRLLLAVDGYRYGTKDVDRREQVGEIVEALDSIDTVVWWPYLDPGAAPPDVRSELDVVGWDELLAEPAPLTFDRVPFDHPLYVLYSSGTTGLPKPIVHGHGGITVEHLKSLSLHHDLGPDDTFFWFSTTGWMMWNLLVSGLGTGATIVLVDGNPAHPDLGALWRMVDELAITSFGTSAPFLLQCRKEGVVPREIADLSRLRAVGSTGAPLPAEGFRWVYEAVGEVHLQSVSGGTDVCAAFVGAAPTVPVWAGEISCRALGAAVDAYDEQGRSVVGSLGELVVTRPMPSMPVGFWGDDDGSRYRAAYFEDIEGVWRHGDWITITDRGSCVITGRSDATLNRGGVRLGTSEFYAVVESLPEVTDSLVVHLEDAADDADASGAGTLVLLVVLAEDADPDQVRTDIATALRSRLSPRHVPDELHVVRALPRTLSGKKLEVPVKKILQGVPADEAATRGALADPTALDEVTTVARRRG